MSMCAQQENTNCNSSSLDLSLASLQSSIQQQYDISFIFLAWKGSSGF